MLLLTVGAFCAFLIYDAYEKQANQPQEMLDIAMQIKTNEKNAFSFLPLLANSLSVLGKQGVFV